MITLYIN